jgi:RNA polymerase sigma-70 factor (ECF subfamily)
VLSRARFEQLFEECEGPFYNIALRWVWNPGVAREIVQETFLRVWARRLVIRQGRAGAYAHRCLLNLCHDHARRRARADVSLDHDPGDDGAGGAEDELLRGQLRAALETLPQIQRDVVLLAEFGGLKQREIAEILDIAPGTVGSRRNAALKALRKKLT